MQQYIIRRLLLNIPVLLLLITLVFGATHLQPDFAVRRATGAVCPGCDPKAAVEAVRKELGIDKPLAQQYFIFLGNTLRGDLGESFITKKPVLAEIKDRIGPSVELGILQLIVAISVSVPVGVISAIRQDTPIDYGLRIFSILGLAIPSFYLGILFLILALRAFNWIPPLNFTDYKGFFEDPLHNLQQMAIPSIAGGLALGAGVMRLLRSQMLEVLRQDYVRTAWSKGLHERTVIIRHALKNAFIPVLTVLGLLVAGLFSGNVVLESIFGIPGIGPIAVVGFTNNDFPMIYGAVLVVGIALVITNLVVDMMYAWVDPRIRYS